MKDHDFWMSVQGRLADHLGKHLYKQRPAALAELVSNSWDACATQCLITIPEGTYSPESAEIYVDDDGRGMSPLDVQYKFLVLSRNRREEEGTAETSFEHPKKGTINRRVMGRKGIGKLAGFGVAQRIEVISWQGATASKFTMDSQKLRLDHGKSGRIRIPGQVEVEPPNLGFSSGTRVILSHFKQKAPLDIPSFREALARRFSRRVLGNMGILINGIPLGEPPEWLNLTKRFPEGNGFNDLDLAEGKARYWYGYHNGVIKPAEAQGVVVIANGKIAQQTPFFFGAETGTRQHASRYITGVFEADFLDAGSSDEDDESDIISTDRQEIDWEHERARELYSKAGAILRRAFSEWGSDRERKTLSLLETDAELSERFSGLVIDEQRKITEVAKAISHAEKEPERERQLLDTLLRAYEFRAFHDVLGHLEQSHHSEMMLAEILEHLTDWKVIESRALLEIVSTRLQIVDKFQDLVVNRAPEKAANVGGENLHDLLARHPWLLNPSYQIIAEEKSIRAMLREREHAVCSENKDRIDFLAIAKDQQLTIIEIKRPGHPVAQDELNRLNNYLEAFRSTWSSVKGVFVATKFSVSEEGLRAYRAGFDIISWSDLFQDARKFLEHFRAILMSDVRNPSFASREQEIKDSRATLRDGAYIPKTGPKGNAGRLGVQDSEPPASDDVDAS